MENSLKNLNDLKEYYKKLYVDQHVPFAIRRTSDGAMLLLNNDFKTYSFEALRVIQTLINIHMIGYLKMYE